MPRSPETTRRKLLEAAARCFLRNGYHGTGLGGILAASGVTKGAMFHHFDGKEALAVAVIDELLEPDLRHRWWDPLVQCRQPLDTLRQIITEVREAVERGGDDLGSLPSPLPVLAPGCESAPLLRQRLATLRQTWIAAIAAALHRGRELGSVHRSVVPDDEAAFLLSWLEGIAATALLAADPGALHGSFRAADAYLDTLRAAAG